MCPKSKQFHCNRYLPAKFSISRLFRLFKSMYGYHIIIDVSKHVIGICAKYTRDVEHIFKIHQLLSLWQIRAHAIMYIFRVAHSFMAKKIGEEKPAQKKLVLACASAFLWNYLFIFSFFSRTLSLYPSLCLVFSSAIFSRTAYFVCAGARERRSIRVYLLETRNQPLFLLLEIHVFIFFHCTLLILCM